MSHASRPQGLPNEYIHVAVIGAGIVGVCTAIGLRELGYRVSLIEPSKVGGEQAASFGNGAWISPASVVPMSTPGLWRRLPGLLFNPGSPLTVRWADIARLAPWLLRFMWAGATYQRVLNTSQALHQLLHDAPRRHAALASAAGLEGMIVPSGLLYVYPDRAAFVADSLAWGLRRSCGVVWQELEGAALKLKAPALSPSYTLGVWVASGAYCQDPGAYTLALHGYAQRLGVQAVQATVLGLDFEGGRLRSLVLQGKAGVQDKLACDRAVLAAGIHSKALAQAAGDSVCMESERGYHVQLPFAGLTLPVPMMPSDGKMANTPLAMGLRASGQVELASVDAPPNWGRAQVLLDHLRHTYGPLNTQGMSRWMGHRPSTPDGLPVIRYASRSKDVVYAFGHGHVGLATAPATASKVCELMQQA